MQRKINVLTGAQLVGKIFMVCLTRSIAYREERKKKTPLSLMPKEVYSFKNILFGVFY